MRNTVDWLAIAKYGRDAEKKALVDALPSSVVRFSVGDPVTTLFRTFYANEVAKLFLYSRQCKTGLDWNWLDEDVFYEAGDANVPSRGVMATTIGKDGRNLLVDVRAPANAKPRVHDDGSKHISFKNTHNADIILWYDAPNHAICVCKRNGAKFSKDSPDYHGRVDYTVVGATDTTEMETSVNELILGHRGRMINNDEI
jgi:hypothetical protein